MVCNLRRGRWSLNNLRPLYSPLPYPPAGDVAVLHTGGSSAPGLCPAVLQLHDPWIVADQFQPLRINCKKTSGRNSFFSFFFVCKFWFVRDLSCSVQRETEMHQIPTQKWEGHPWVFGNSRLASGRAATDKPSQRGWEQAVLGSHSLTRSPSGSQPRSQLTSHMLEPQLR